MKHYQLLHFFTKHVRIISLLNSLHLSFKKDGSLDLLLLFKFPPFEPCRCPHTDTSKTTFTTIWISFPFLRLQYSTEQSFCQSMNIHRSTCLLLIAEWYVATSHVLLRPIIMTCLVWAFDSRASSLSYLSLNCSYSVFLIDDFSGRSESHLLFPSQS